MALLRVVFNWLLRTCFLKSHHNNWLHTDGYLQILWRQFDFWTSGSHLTSFKEWSEWVEGGESALVTVVIKLERISYFIRSFTAICNAIINRTGTGFLDARASHHGYKLEQVYIGYQYSHLIDNAPSTIACISSVFSLLYTYVKLKHCPLTLFFYSYIAKLQILHIYEYEIKFSAILWVYQKKNN